MARPVIVLPKSLEAIREYPLLGQKMESEEGAAQVEGLIREALAEHPEHGLPHAAWGWLLAKRKEWVDAIESVTRAIELGPEPLAPQWYLDRGVYQSFLGHWKAAMSDMTEVCRRWPEDDNGHLLRSLEFKKLGDGLSCAVEEQFALHLNGQLTADQLCEFFHSYPFYASPERLEATFMVLCEPLNPQARAYRGELMLNLGVPTAAYHDYQVAAEIDKRNLGLLARLEEIRQQGLLVDPPLIAPEKPKVEIWPVYRQVLDQCNETFEAVKQFAPGERPSLTERLFGRVKSRLTYNNRSVGLNYIIYGMLISMVTNLYASTILELKSFVKLNRFPAGFAPPPHYTDIIQFAQVLSACCAVARLFGIYLSVKGVFRLIRGTKKKDPNELVEIFDYAVGFVMFILFSLICGAPYALILAIYSEFNS